MPINKNDQIRISLAQSLTYARLTLIIKVKVKSTNISTFHQSVRHFNCYTQAKCRLNWLHVMCFNIEPKVRKIAPPITIMIKQVMHSGVYPIKAG